MAHLSDFISRYRQAADQALTAIEQLRALDQQFMLCEVPKCLEEEDFAGSNADLDPQSFSAYLNAVMGLEKALAAEDNAGWKALYKLRGK